MAEEQLLAVLKAETSQFRAEMRRATVLLDGMAQDVHRSTQVMQQGFGTLSPAIRAVGVALASIGLAAFVREAIQASTQMTVITNALKVITGSAQAAGATLTFLRQEAQRLGLNFLDAAKGFQGMAAAARNTVVEGKGVQTIFLAISEASRVMGLGTDQTSRLLVGMQQIMGKNVVQMEEWRQQISEALPQATQTLARALGVTTEELFAFIAQGRIGLPEVVKFAEQLRRDVAGGIEEAGKTFQAAAARMGNAFQELLITLGDVVTKNPTLIQAINAITAALQELRAEVERNHGPLNTLMTLIGRIITNAAQLPQKLGLTEMGALTHSIEETAKEIASVETRLSNLQKLGATKPLKFLAESFLFPGAGGLPGVIAATSAELEALRQKMGELRGERILLMQRQQGITPPAPEIPGMEMLGGAPQEAGGGIGKAIRARLDVFKDLAKLRAELADLESMRPFASVLPADEAQALNQRIDGVRDRIQQMLDPSKTKAGMEKASHEMQRVAREQQDIAESTVKAQFDIRREHIKTAEEAGLASQMTAKQMQQTAETMQAAWAEYLVALQGVGAKEQELNRERAAGEIEVSKLQRAAREQLFKESIDAAKQEAKAWEESIKVGEAYVTQQFEIRKAGVETSEDLRQAMEQYLDELRFVEAGEEKLARVRTTLTTEATRMQRRELEEGTRHTQRELEKQVREWEHFAERVHDHVLARVYDIFSGRIKDIRDLFSSLKDTFLLVLSEMVTAAIARPIVVPIVVSIVGGVTGPLVGGALQAGMQGVGMAGTGGLLGGLTGLLATPLIAGSVGGTGALAGGTGAEFLGAGGFAGAEFGAGGVGAGGGAAGLTVGGALGGVGLGVGTGFLAQQLIGREIGGRGGSAFSGAAGGAVTGAMIGSVVPGVGTLIGAAAGALLGGALGSLFGGGKKKKASLDVQSADLLFEIQNGVLEMVRFNVASSARRLGDTQEISQAITDVGIAALQPLMQSIHQFAPQVQQALMTPLNELANVFETELTRLDFKVAAKEGGQRLKQLLEQDVPALVEEVFAPLQAVLQRVAPIFQALDQTVQALEQRRGALLGGIAQLRQQLTEAVMSPARLFETRRSTFEALLSQFRGAGAGEQVRLVPQLTQMVGDLFQLAQQEEVLGTDRPALLEFQRTMLDVLNELERTTISAIDPQIALAEAQVDILANSLSHLASIDSTIQQTNAVLHQLTAFMQSAFAGNFQHGGIVPRTGFAMVHKGEPIGAGAITITINAPVTVSGGVSPAQAKQTAQTLRDELLNRVVPELNRITRFRQGR